MWGIIGEIVIAAAMVGGVCTAANYLHKRMVFGKVDQLLRNIEAQAKRPTPPPTAEEEEMYKKVLLVQTKCKMAGIYVDDLQYPEVADAAKKKIEDSVTANLAIAQEVTDEFCNSTMRHSISDLLCRAGEFERASRIIEDIAVDFIREKATAFYHEEK